MVNVSEFLSEHTNELGVYALVTYDNRVEATWFCKYPDEEEGYWFLESPCILYKMVDIEGDEDKFLREFVNELYCLEDGVDIDEYIGTYMKHMIVDKVLYEIVNFQCCPYLPKYVDNIQLISERECLEYLLNKEKGI